MTYFLYMVTCKVPKHIYIGHTQDFLHRASKHKKGEGAAFIRRYGFKNILLIKNFVTRSEASIEESKLTKRLRKLKGFVVNGSGYTRD